MKTKITILAIALASITANAQVAPAQPPTPSAGMSSNSDASSGGFKPEGGNWTFELNFAPTFSSNPISLNYLRARLFLSDDMALRTGFSVGMHSEGDEKAGGKNSIFDWALLPGIEKHFTGTDRLSPYVGAELALAGRSSSTKMVDEDLDITTEYTGAWEDGSHSGFFNLGVNLLIGTDFYIAKHFYVGMEAGFGMNMKNDSDRTVTVTADGESSSDTVEGGSTFQLGPNFNSAIRIGFAF